MLQTAHVGIRTTARGPGHIWGACKIVCRFKKWFNMVSSKVRTEKCCKGGAVVYQLSNKMGMVWGKQ